MSYSKKYQDDKSYQKVGNEWISIDQFLTKDQVIKLIDLMLQYFEMMESFKQDADSKSLTELFIKQLAELKEELKR